MWFGLILLLSVSLTLAHRYVTGFDPAGATATAPLLVRLISAVAIGVLPSSLLAAAITHFSAARSMKYQIAGPLVVALCLASALFGGALLLSSEPVQQIPQSAALPEGRLVRIGSLRFFAVGREGLIVSPLLVEEIGMTGGAGFTVRPQAVLDPRDGSLVVPGLPEETIDVRQLDNSFGAMARTPDLLVGLVADIAGLSRAVRLVPGNRGSALANLGALALFGVSLWSLARLTKWPLFNMLFVLAALRFALWIVPAIQSGSLRDIFLGVFSAGQLPLASAAAIAIVAVAFLAILVFLPPLAEWRREVLGE